jgi:hypothetical protein
VPPEHQGPVEALRAHCPHEALCVRVGVRLQLVGSINSFSGPGRSRHWVSSHCGGMQRRYLERAIVPGQGSA